MGDSDSADTAPTSGRRSGNVWARPDVFGSNPVRQLLVPAGVVHAIVGENGALEVRNNHGAWPASPVDLPMDNGLLWVRLPLGARAGRDAHHGIVEPSQPAVPVRTRRGAGQLPGRDHIHRGLTGQSRTAVSAARRCPRGDGLLDDQVDGAGHSSHADGNWQDRDDAGPARGRSAVEAAGPGAVGCTARAGCREVRNPRGTPGARHCERPCAAPGRGTPHTRPGRRGHR